MFVVLRLQMLIQGKNKIKYSNSEARFHAGFVATSFFLLVFIHFAALVNFNFNQGNLQSKQGKTSYQPVHHHSQSGTTIPVAELLRETEVEEKSFTDDDTSLSTNLSLHTIESSVTPENLQLQFLQSLQNRPTRSLFILHHSWKSFLI
jgi:hypothetical protein